MINEPTLIILLPGFPKNEEDDLCLPAHQNFIRSINKHYPSVKLHILAFQYPFEKKEYEWNGNKVVAFGGKNRGGLSRWLLWQRIAKKLNELKKENNIIGVLSFWAGECAYVGKRWAEKNGLPHYAWLMGQDAKKENRYIGRAKLTGDELIVLSDFTSNELRTNHGLVAAFVIPLGIDPAQVPAETYKRNIDIISVGSLIQLKQYHLCIDIVIGLKKQFPDLRMMICGSGPEKEKLNSLIHEKGLTANIFLAVDKSHSEVLLLMKQSKLFLHPSSYEGFGTVCLEALSAGTPVVSFTKPMKEDIDKWFVVDSTEQMIKQVASLLNAPGDGQPFYPYTIDGTTKNIMSIFGL